MEESHAGRNTSCCWECYLTIGYVGAHVKQYYVFLYIKSSYVIYTILTSMCSSLQVLDTLRPPLTDSPLHTGLSIH